MAMDLDDCRIKFATRDIGFKVLGTACTLDNSCNREMVRRVQSAWASFAKHRAMLCYKKGS